MRDRQNCIDCGKQSPETETNYTLISAQFGWRLTRRRAENGEFIVEWRCPDCWRKHKQKHQDEPASVPNQASAGYSSGSQLAGAPASTPSLSSLAAAQDRSHERERAPRTSPPPSSASPLKTSRPPPANAPKSSKPPPGAPGAAGPTVRKRP